MAERVTYREFNEKVIKFSGLAIVDFYSDFCVPCKKILPVLSALEKEYQEDIFITKVNVAYEKELVEEYQIRSTPTFLFFKNGKIVEQFSGVRKKEELEQIIESYREKRERKNENYSSR
ncbi:MAG: thioredoxin family protein [Lachnospiraceae bacterium]|nr:thioredoxin family protein [Lachnospiraceae bacterium]